MLKTFKEVEVELMLCGLSTYDIMQNDTYSKLVDAIN